jgi:acyl-CoA synthetase (AMP-forming)/AMP-acid ligase II
MGALLARAYARYPRRTAVASRGSVLTFEELRQRVHRAARALESLGMVPGERVAIWLENGRPFLEVEQAAFLCGFVRTALSPMLHVREVAHIVEDCAPRVVVTDRDRAQRLPRCRRTSPWWSSTRTPTPPATWRTRAW